MFDDRSCVIFVLAPLVGKGKSWFEILSSKNGLYPILLISGFDFFHQQGKIGPFCLGSLFLKVDLGVCPGLPGKGQCFLPLLLLRRRGNLIAVSMVLNGKRTVSGIQNQFGVDLLKQPYCRFRFVLIQTNAPEQDVAFAQKKILVPQNLFRITDDCCKQYFGILQSHILGLGGRRDVGLVVPGVKNGLSPFGLRVLFAARHFRRLCGTFRCVRSFHAGGSGRRLYSF